jgi:hypothetical protein
MAEHAPDADSVEAFKQALAEYSGWTAGGPEPRVLFKPSFGLQHPEKISLLALWATEFGDCKLPPVIFDYIFDLMDDTLENQRMKVQLNANRSWGIAGQVFEKLIANRNKQYGNS